MSPALTPFQRFHRLAEAAAFLGVLCTLAGFLGKYAWFLDFFSYFKLQLAFCFLFYAGIEFAARRHRLAAAGLAFSILNAAPALLLFLPADAYAKPPTPVARIRILQANVLTCNTNTPALFSLIAKENPDVIVLQEPDDWWLRQLAPLTNGYPVRACLARDDNFGAAIFCRTNALEADIFTLSDPDRAPCTHARIAANGRTLTVVGTHTLAPYNDAMWRGRNRFTLELARALRKERGPLVVTGDFNNTPWSSHFRTFLVASGLLDSEQGRGPQPTWPTSSPPLVRIPLDHCFHSADVSIVGRRTGPDIGSDHLPLIIDAAF